MPSFSKGRLQGCGGEDDGPLVASTLIQVQAVEILLMDRSGERVREERGSLIGARRSIPSMMEMPQRGRIGADEDFRHTGAAVTAGGLP